MQQLDASSRHHAPYECANTRFQSLQDRTPRHATHGKRAAQYQARLGH